VVSSCAAIGSGAGQRRCVGTPIITDGQLCRPVSRRKRQVQRQIDHAMLAAVTKARVALAPRRSDAVDVLAANGRFKGWSAVTLRASGGCGRRCQAPALPARATPSSRAIDPTGGRAQMCRPVRCRCPWTSMPLCPCAARLSLSSTRLPHRGARSPAALQPPARALQPCSPASRRSVARGRPGLSTTTALQTRVRIRSEQGT
jgi:hypothetical protein